MKITVDHNAPEIAAAIAKAPDQVLPRVTRALERGAEMVQDHAQQAAPKAVGKMAKDIGIVSMPLEARVIAHAAYTPPVEFGNGPRTAPKLAELMEWVRVKRIQPRTPGMSAVTLASIIRRSIWKKGIKAQPFFFPSLDATRPRLADLMQRAVTDGLADFASTAKGAGRV